jgi:hypothetical protein
MSTHVLPASAERGKRSIALATSVVLLASGVFAALVSAQGLYSHFMEGKTIAAAATSTAFPVLLYLAWLGAAAGIAGTVLTLFVEGYRARWFWRCLCGAAVLWALLVPIGTVIGLISLVLLVATRTKFPQ